MSTLLLIGTLARALTVIAAASVAARGLVLLRSRPYASRTRRSSLQMLSAFSCTITVFSFVSAASLQSVHASTAVHPFYLFCFYLAHRFLSDAESEAPPPPKYHRLVWDNGMTDKDLG